MPAKVAQLKPRGPGVISAMATMSDTSLAVIQPWAITSLLMRGIMDSPPKLVNPIFRKLQNSSSSTIAVPSSPLIYFTDGQPGGNAHQHQKHTVHVPDQVQGEGGRRHRHTGWIPEGTLHQIQGGGGHDGHDGGPHPGHGRHHPVVVPHGGV